MQKKGRMQITHLYIWLSKLLQNVGKEIISHGVMGSVNLGAQVGVGEPFSALREGGVVPMKTAVEVTVGERTWELRNDSKVWYRRRQLSFLQSPKAHTRGSCCASCGRRRTGSSCLCCGSSGSPQRGTSSQPVSFPLLQDQAPLAARQRSPAPGWRLKAGPCCPHRVVRRGKKGNSSSSFRGHLSLTEL